MPRIVLATANPHKVAELRTILADTAPDGVELLGLADLGPPFPEPAETGDTFEANSRLKAASYAQHTGHWCLADDSGLEVDALHGRPGVISSHFSTDGREEGLTRAQRDHANNDRLLRDLLGVPPERRTARFVCVMTLAGPAGDILATSRGVVEGRIGLPGEVPRGGHGFGYDPLFLLAPDFRLTTAELSDAEKNALSHRGRAARAMAQRLRAIMQLPGS
jgi:XTP/dITP diphosphohydrolase